MVGLICPSSFEYRFLDKKMLERAGARVVCSGMGKVRASAACHRLVRSGARSIVLIGFAGGLTRNLSVGDLVEPSVFIEQDYNAEPFERFPNKIRKKRGVRLIRAAKDCWMLTQDRFLTENPYGAKTGSKRLACDMESYAVSYFCETFGLRYSVVKLVSDSADENAEHDFLKACKRLAPRLNRIAATAVRAIGKD